MDRKDWTNIVSGCTVLAALADTTKLSDEQRGQRREAVLAVEKSVRECLATMGVPRNCTQDIMEAVIKSQRSVP